MLRLTLFASFLALAVPAASAQVGVGGILGDPTGLTLKIGTQRGVIADIGLEDNLFVQAHFVVLESRIAVPSADVRSILGIGGFVGDAGSETTLGPSVLFGVSYYVAPVLEVFGQSTLGLRLTPDLDVRSGLAVGVRFYPTEL